MALPVGGIGIGVGVGVGLGFGDFFELGFFYIVKLLVGIGTVATLLFLAFLLFAYVFKNPVKHTGVAGFLFAARQEKPADKLYQKVKKYNKGYSFKDHD